ncbi:histone-lysine N-methyltransferase SETMAR [Elysia marginata]|uniref:Histone-lysine N-methyltransferase SETMAR n=1 Tax=Elysia marginata TaxID=1093978 RepID=A0AAV4GHD1_9GAST|nr:histone-lysine N-methyltransferase SETMAR [Elysia marginata]
MARRHCEDDGKYVDQRSERQRRVEMWCGGPYPAVDGRSLNQSINQSIWTLGLQSYPSTRQINPHTAKRTKERLERNRRDILPYPAHSPDLAPSDFHLFVHLKRHLGGKKLED